MPNPTPTSLSKGKRLSIIISDLIGVIGEIVLEQATREFSGDDWGWNMVKELKRINKEVKKL